MKQFVWEADSEISYETASLEERSISEDSILEDSISEHDSDSEMNDSIPSIATMSIHSRNENSSKKSVSICKIFFTNIFRLSFALFLILYATNSFKISENSTFLINNLNLTANLSISTEFSANSDFVLYLHPVFLITIGAFYLERL